MSSSDGDYPEAQGRALADAVREALARRRISRQTLADQAKISISTLEKVLSGRRPFTLATVIRLEEALGVRLRDGLDRTQPDKPATISLAADDLGAYARAAVSWIEGSYLTLRPSFGLRGAIYAYLTRSPGTTDRRASPSARRSGSIPPSPRWASSRSHTSPATSTW